MALSTLTGSITIESLRTSGRETADAVASRGPRINLGSWVVDLRPNRKRLQLTRPCRAASIPPQAARACRRDAAGGPISDSHMARTRALPLSLHISLDPTRSHGGRRSQF